MPARGEPSTVSALTDREKRIAEAVSEEVLSRIVSLAQDPAVTEKLIGTWTKSADQMVGRALRRFAFYVVTVLLIIGANKWNLGDKFMTFLRG